MDCDTRTYGDDGFKRRSACFCFKDKAEQEVLLVSSNKEKGKWIIPGGGIQYKEDPRCAAKREILEEAGVKGEVCKYLGTLEDITKHKRTFVYTMVLEHQLDEWKEHIQNNRERKWCSIDEAKEELSRKQNQIPFLNLLLKSCEKVVNSL